MPPSRLQTRLSSFDILDRTTAALQSRSRPRARRIDLEDVREVWAALCGRIAESLDQSGSRHAVNVEHFGLFLAQGNGGNVQLQFCKRFLRETGSRQLKVVPVRGMPVKKVTYSGVSSDCRFNKELCRRVVTAVVQTLYEAVSLQNDWVELAFPGLGLFECKRGVCDFVREKRGSFSRDSDRGLEVVAGREGDSSESESDEEEKESTFTDLEEVRVGEGEEEEGGVGQIEAFPPSLARLREKIKQRGGMHGIHSIGRALRIMDDSGDGKLSLAEFRFGLKDFGVKLNPAELEELFYFFDKDKSGNISFDEFLVGLRGSINARRRRLIGLAYNVLDRNGDGHVTVEDMEASYDTRMHPEVISGAKTKAQVLREFLAQFDTLEKDGKVSQQEFEEYYKNVSASIDNDDYFELMIRNAWHISGGKGQYENTTNKRVLVTDANGKQSVKEVKNDMWIDSTDNASVTKALSKQGVTSSKPIGLHYANASAKQKTQFKVPSTLGTRFRERPGTRQDKQGQDSMSKLVEAYAKARLTPEDFLLQLGGNRVFGGTKLQQSAFASGLMKWNKSFTREDGKEIAACLDKNGDGEIDLDELCTHLGGATVVKRLKNKIHSKGHMFQLCNVLCRIDKSGDELIDRNELRDGLTALGLNLNSADMETLFNHFDKDSNGVISISELMHGMSNPLSKRRNQIVRKVFSKLSGGDSFVVLKSLVAAFNAETKQEREDMTHILRTLGGDAKVVKQETFELFYKLIASPIRFDDDFDTMIMSSWEIDHPEIQTRKVLVTHRDGRQTVEQVSKKEFLKHKYQPPERSPKERRKPKHKSRRNKLASQMRDQLSMRKRYQHESWGHNNNQEDDEDPSLHDWTKAYSSGDQNLPDEFDNSIRQEKSPEPLKAKANDGATEPKVLAALRNKIIERGGANGIHTFGRVLRLMDDSGDKCLSREELEYGLKDYGVSCSKAEVGLLFSHLDTDSSGKISFDEFLIGLRGPIPKRRVELILIAFNRLDVTGDGVVTMEDIEQVYDASFHPDVQSGKITAADGLREFFSQFDSIEADGVVTEQEFVQYYKNVSASIDSDDYFELMMRNAWHISGGKGQCANTTNRRVLVTHKDGRQTVEEVEDDLWVDKTNAREIHRRLHSKGIHPVGDVGHFHASEDMENPRSRGTRKGYESTINLGWDEDDDGKRKMEKRWQKERKIRGGAATQVQSLARAHRARKNTQRMIKQRKIQNQLDREEMREAERMKNRIIRPKGKNWY